MKDIYQIIYGIPKPCPQCRVGTSNVARRISIRQNPPKGACRLGEIAFIRACECGYNGPLNTDELNFAKDNSGNLPSVESVIPAS